MRHAFVTAFLLFLVAPVLAQDAPIPPKDAEWTIYCTEISGADHIHQAKNLRVSLVRQTGLRDWYVVQGDTQSRLFYGFYRTVDRNAAEKSDRKEAVRAHDELQKIQQFASADGTRPFARATLVQINTPDPDGPPEWNLLNINRGKAQDDPVRAWFTLQVAAFKDHPERKQAAVDAVREFRKRGIEAYYHHGETVSEVCIGTWPRNAVEIQDTGTGSANSDQPLIVFNTPMSPEAIRNVEQANPNSKVVAPAQLMPIDDGLKHTMTEYPNMYINGEVHGTNRKDATGAATLVPDPSFIVLVPVPKQSLMDAPAVPVIAPPPPTLARPNSPSGGGKLKSLDD